MGQVAKRELVELIDLGILRSADPGFLVPSPYMSDLRDYPIFRNPSSYSWAPRLPNSAYSTPTTRTHRKNGDPLSTLTLYITYNVPED